MADPCTTSTDHLPGEQHVWPMMKQCGMACKRCAWSDMYTRLPSRRHDRPHSTSHAFPTPSHARAHTWDSHAVQHFPEPVPWPLPAPSSTTCHSRCHQPCRRPPAPSAPTAQPPPPHHKQTSAGTHTAINACNTWGALSHSPGHRPPAVPPGCAPGAPACPAGSPGTPGRPVGVVRSKTGVTGEGGQGQGVLETIAQMLGNKLRAADRQPRHFWASLRCREGTTK